VRVSLVAFLALRFLGASRRAGRGAPALLSILGVAVGVMTLTVVLGVMNGFQLGFIESIVEISSYHLQLRAPGGAPLDPAALAAARALPEVTAVVPFAEEQVLVEGSFQRPRACLIRAVPPDLLTQDPSQARMLRIDAGSFSLDAPGSVVIGSELAAIIGVRVGDRVSLVSVAAEGGRPAPRRALFTVRGTFRCGYYDYDAGLAFVSLGSAPLIGGSRTALTYGVKIADRFADAEAARRISAALGPGTRVESWRAFNRSFFDALFMEKLMMMVLVGLIFVVVGFNIHSSLRRSIREKVEEIAVLKAVGVPPRSLQYAFVAEGAAIGGIGALTGMIAGLLVAANINGLFALVELVVNALRRAALFAASPFLGGASREGFTIFSPLYFYLTEVPSRVLFPEAFFVASFAVLACLLASYGASRAVAGFRPAEVLRYE
jgi:lipoprotein-releasing system permease protein